MNDSVAELARKAEAKAHVVSSKLGLDPALVPGVVQLAFYDFFILCGMHSKLRLKFRPLYY